jgi:CubicO group peptidase (beta-lactamase class C family)
MKPASRSPEENATLDPRFAPACQILKDAIAARAFPGCAFGVLADDTVVIQKALGRFTYEDGARAVIPDTIYDVASLTKVVATTAVAMLLYQRNQLDLDTPLGDLLPGFIVGRSSVEHARLVTLRHLLAHSSGLPGYVPLYKTVDSPAALFRALLQLPIEVEPGTRAEYSDPGFILLGKALEVLTREYLAPWIRKELYDPLGLSSTGFCPPAELRPSIPPTEEDASFRRRRIQGEVQDEHAWLLRGAGGHAGLFSNVPDLLRFAHAILAGLDPRAAAPHGPSAFQAHVIEVFSQRQPPEGSTRALGWDTPSPDSSAGSAFSRHSIGHLGYSGCSLWIDLDARIAVVLLSNRTWPDRSSQLIRQVRPAFHNAIRQALRSPAS